MRSNGTPRCGSKVPSTHVPFRGVRADGQEDDRARRPGTTVGTAVAVGYATSASRREASGRWACQVTAPFAPGHLARVPCRTMERVEVRIAAAAFGLPGTLTIPDAPVGLVLFAHGSGSSRASPRNVWVADRLHTAGVGTLLFDLLDPSEADDRRNVFDVRLLAERLTTATDHVAGLERGAGLPIGYFGASTGAAAALMAAADRGDAIGAVVSRGGRPDLAGPALPLVRAPTLLIVGGRDGEVLALNRDAQAHLTCRSDLIVVPGATHLFEEPGTLEAVASLAADWFIRYLGNGTRPDDGSGRP